MEAVVAAGVATAAAVASVEVAVAVSSALIVGDRVAAAVVTTVAA